MNKTSHPIDELELMAYLDGDLPRERAAAAAAHLEDCRECQGLANDLKDVSQEIATWQITPPDFQITAEMVTALDEYVRKQEGIPKRRHSNWREFLRIRWVWASGAIAATVILFFSTFIFNTRLNYFAPAPKRTVSSQPITVDSDSRASAADAAQKGTIGKLEKNGQRDVTAGREGEVAIPTGPMVIRTAELTLVSADFAQVRTRLEDILKRRNGYLGQLSVTGSSDSPHTLTATLRIPADKLDAAIAELKTLGRVESESQKGDEVSQQYVDLQARLSNARTTEQTLLEILRTRTGILSDVLAVEHEIAAVREQIERLEAEKKSLEKQVAFSTVNLNVTEDFKPQGHVVPDSTSRRIRNAAVDGYETLVAGLINVLLCFVSWGPSLLVWGLILLLPARMLWKRWQKRNVI